HGLRLTLFPVVVESENGAVLIVQFKSGIEQRSCNSSSCQGRSHRAEHDDWAVAAADDDTADHYVVVGAYEAARADIREGGAVAGSEVVNFHQTVTGAAILAREGYRVISRRQTGNDRGFQIVLRGDASIHDF